MATRPAQAFAKCGSLSTSSNPRIYTYRPYICASHRFAAGRLVRDLTPLHHTACFEQQRASQLLSSFTDAADHTSRHSNTPQTRSQLLATSVQPAFAHTHERPPHRSAADRVRPARTAARRCRASWSSRVEEMDALQSSTRRLRAMTNREARPLRQWLHRDSDGVLPVCCRRVRGSRLHLGTLLPLSGRRLAPW
jgi:hypothetical protein